MRKILSVVLGLFLTFNLFSKPRIITGNQAAAIVPNAVLVRYNDRSPLPNFVRFANYRALPQAKFQSWIQQFFKSGNTKTSFTLIKATKDRIGFTHREYQEKIDGIPVQWGRVKTHVKAGMIYSFSGELYPATHNTTTPSLSKQAALQNALNHIGAQKYQWQIPVEEAYIKKIEHNPSATYYPKGVLTYIYNQNKPSNELRLAYRFNIYASKPVSRNMVWVDAVTGKILYTENLIWEINNSNGIAHTQYSGIRNIITDSISPTLFKLEEANRDTGITNETLNLQNTTNYGSAIDFTDQDNNWNNVNAALDQYATDAYWGQEKVIDFYYQKFQRNSIDNNGMTVLGYMHCPQGGGSNVNAFWDGQEMNYGDGGSGYNPIVGLDVIGHEMTHGVTGNTANLNYQDESGALNESFSDIFGNTIEHWAKPATASWDIGEGMGGAPFRNMANPNQYQQPDTYEGTDWYTGTQDDGGVHENSGVQNFWYYLMVEGGSGTNDNGDAYNVTGLGWDTASAITYRSLTIYLSPNSQYADARFYAIQAAEDLYGGCSLPVETTTNAWYAVGVGAQYSPTVTTDFASSETTSCSVPFQVSFTNNSTNGISYHWDFGDGSTSTQTSPTHTYTTYGTYTVKLVTDGGSCGVDSIIKTDYIDVDSTNPCVVTLPPTGVAATQSSCTGTIYDSGGPNANYSDNENSSVTIAPAGASYVTLTFNSFDVESNTFNNSCYDELKVYDGSSTAAPLIGTYCTVNPPPTTIQSTGGAITIAFTSDESVNKSGFDIGWQCSMPSVSPITNFTVDNTTSCDGTIHFTDQSINGPTSWLWNFGDGDTSTLQNPTHTYAASGTYTVSLTTSNGYGNDQNVKTNLITVTLPTPLTSVTGDSICAYHSATLTATGGNGTIEWFSDSLGNDLIGTGSPFTTPSLTSDTTFYAANTMTYPVISGGPADNSIGSGGNYTGNAYLIFNVDTSMELISVKVYAQAAVTRTFELLDAGGNVLQSKVVNIPASATNGYAVNLNFAIYPGTNYKLGVAEAQANLYRNNGGAVYPYALGNLGSITGTSFGSQAPGYYYMFYDWKVSKMNCHSALLPAKVHVHVCAGINNLTLNNGIKIYPNPARNDFNLSINKISEPLKVSVFNEIGQLIFTQEINSTGIYHISTANFSDGVYHINIRGMKTGKTLYKKLVVMK